MFSYSQTKISFCNLCVSFFLQKRIHENFRQNRKSYSLKFNAFDNFQAPFTRFCNPCIYFDIEANASRANNKNTFQLGELSYPKEEAAISFAQYILRRAGKVSSGLKGMYNHVVNQTNSCQVTYFQLPIVQLTEMYEIVV